eukprot:g31216.t1
MAHINSSLPTCLNPLQFAYHRNRSTADAISVSPHSSLEYLDNKDAYIRLLLIDYRSAFNTIIPSGLISKLQDLGLSSALCNWILSFVTLRPQSVKIDNCISSRITLNTGASQGCVLTPLLYSLKNGGEHAPPHPPIYINRAEVERVESVKLLGVTITENLSSTSHVKKAQQRLFFLRRLRKFSMSI